MNQIEPFNKTTGYFPERGDVKTAVVGKKAKTPALKERSNNICKNGVCAVNWKPQRPALA
jgi:hypothetical protein